MINLGDGVVQRRDRTIGYTITCWRSLLTASVTLATSVRVTLSCIHKTYSEVSIERFPIKKFTNSYSYRAKILGTTIPIWNDFPTEKASAFDNRRCGDPRRPVQAPTMSFSPSHKMIVINVTVSTCFCFYKSVIHSMSY
ncbi:hypothetical protein AVEN_101175-1 [Araneus ventricosus]|uniref:Uncharacterized protein n=1 Tax=Araneus ventricosus TaxID=182803 RepID=A0A4Y2DEP3_ARAVE|nr:hypothetical protein AVEN_101175-1 [Araneus ventricosus]